MLQQSDAFRASVDSLIFWQSLMNVLLADDDPVHTAPSPALAVTPTTCLATVAANTNWNRLDVGIMALVQLTKLENDNLIGGENEQTPPARRTDPTDLISLDALSVVCSRAVIDPTNSIVVYVLEQ